MKSPEQILEEGERLHRKRKEYEIAVARLRHTTRSNRWGGFAYLIVAGLLWWCVHHLFMSPEPMTKSDGLRLLVFALVIGTQLHAGISQLCRDPKDTALLNLIEEKLRDYEKGA